MSQDKFGVFGQAHLLENRSHQRGGRSLPACRRASLLAAGKAPEDDSRSASSWRTKPTMIAKGEGLVR